MTWRVSGERLSCGSRFLSSVEMTHLAVIISLSCSLWIPVHQAGAEVSPSTLFAVASILEGCAYINGSPQNTFVPGAIELAVQKGVFIGGDDFKSGQTKVKSVLVDFLVSAGIKVRKNESAIEEWIKNYTENTRDADTGAQIKPENRLIWEVVSNFLQLFITFSFSWG